MFRSAVIASIFLCSPVGAQFADDNLCDLNALYKMVQNEALKVAGLPETAKFPDLSDVDIKQTGISCIFEMSLSFSVENLDGEATTFAIDAKADRLFNHMTGEVAPPHVRVTFVSQD
jgi:hypothetical protein